MGSRNMKLILAYDGSGYLGWQRLKAGEGKKSIQAVLEEALFLALQERIKVTGSGRTDKGVHALGQAANFICCSRLAAEEMRRRIQEVLPEDICILEMEEVSSEFHSRKSALSKTYEYRFEVSEVPFVFHRKYAYAIPEEPDTVAMEAAALELLGTHDFRGFSSEKRKEYDTVRRIDDICFEKVTLKRGRREIKQLRLQITGNGFLYNMVRIIGGTLLEIGQGKRSAKDIPNIFSSKKREEAGFTLPPEGLYLREVSFPVEIKFKIK